MKCNILRFVWLISIFEATIIHVDSISSTCIMPLFIPPNPVPSPLCLNRCQSQHDVGQLNWVVNYDSGNTHIHISIINCMLQMRRWYDNNMLYQKFHPTIQLSKLMLFGWCLCICCMQWLWRWSWVVSAWGVSYICLLWRKEQLFDCNSISLTFWPSYVSLQFIIPLRLYGRLYPGYAQRVRVE